MQRREFIAGLAGLAAISPRGTQAQQQGMRRVGVLKNGPKDDPDGLAELAALRQGLVQHGWIEGRTIVLEVRWPGGNIESIEASVKELVGLKPDVLLTETTPATVALKKQSGSIPIVFVGIAEPIEQGLVQSLARPGGTLTGFTNIEASVGAKMVQLLKETDPRILQVAVIYNPATAPFAGSYMRSIDEATRLGVEIIAMPVGSGSDIEAAMTMFASKPGSGLVTIPDSFTAEHRDLIVALAARLRLPAIYGTLYFATRSGGLMAYAIDRREMMRSAADYVDRILKGTKPSDLPVQEPTRFSFVINRKTADALGLTIPPHLYVFADEVIE
jgi:putative tryptophan/tyrosine transport system substrate-binding protein